MFTFPLQQAFADCSPVSFHDEGTWAKHRSKDIDIQAVPTAWCRSGTLFCLLLQLWSAVLSAWSAEQCCKSSSFLLLFASQPSLAPLAMKCDTVFRFFTWNQFLKKTNYRKCLQHFSTAANIKHSVLSLWAVLEIQSCSMLEGVGPFCVPKCSFWGNWGSDGAGGTARICGVPEGGLLGPLRLTRNGKSGAAEGGAVLPLVRAQGGMLRFSMCSLPAVCYRDGCSMAEACKKLTILWAAGALLAEVGLQWGRYHWHAIWHFPC